MGLAAELHAPLAYDLTVVAPNGFIRRVASAGAVTATQGATACYEITQGNLSLNLSNAGTAPSTFTITDNRYGASPQTVTVATEVFYTGTGRAVAVTVSVGVIEFGRDGDTMDTLLRVADERLYRAKHNGRNRVVAG